VALTSLQEYRDLLTFRQISELQEILSGTLQDKATRATEFGVSHELTHGKLEVRPGTYGLKECRLTFKDVKPGEFQAKVDGLYDEMNALFMGLPNCPEGWKVEPSGNNDLPEISVRRDLVITFTPLITDSTNRYKYDPFKADDGEFRESQDSLLRKLRLSPVQNDFARLAAGLFRLGQGFPEKIEDIGTVRDRGDLFEGMTVRTFMGSSSASATTCRSGVSDVFAREASHAGVTIGCCGELSCDG
jgi:hypothetical protein